MRKHESLPGFPAEGFLLENAAAKTQPEDFLPRIAAERRLFPTPRGENSFGTEPELFLSADDEGPSCRDLPDFCAMPTAGILPDTEESSFHGATQLLREFLPRAR